MTALSALLVRDMRIAVRVGGGAMMGVLFFLVVVTLTPFAIGPDLALLRRVGPAILWIGALLASLMIGELQSFGILWFAQFALVFQFLLMAVVLILRPQGLFGEKG